MNFEQYIYEEIKDKNQKKEFPFNFENSLWTFKYNNAMEQIVLWVYDRNNKLILHKSTGINEMIPFVLYKYAGRKCIKSEDEENELD